MNKTLKFKKKGNNGITLIALIVTIIVLIILASVTINLLMGDNGVLTRAKATSKIYNEAQAREAVQMAVFSLQMELESQGKSVKISDLNKLSEHDNRIEVDVNNESEEALVTYDSKYVFTLYKDENGNIVIAEEVSEAGKLKPRITKIQVVEAKLNYIKIKVEAKRATSYKYLIKEGTTVDVGNYTEDGTNTTGEYTYNTNIEMDKIYTIKVQAINENGTVEDTKEVLAGAIEQATGARIETETEVNGYAKERTVILPISEPYNTEYQIGTLNLSGTWTEYNSETGLVINENTTVYYRYSYNNKVGNYSEIEVNNIDNEGPEAFTPTITGNAQSKTITIEATALDSGAGVDHYEYTIQAGNSEEASGTISLDGTGKGVKTVTITQETEYSVIVKAVDKLENKTTATGAPQTIDLVPTYTVTLNANGGTFENNITSKQIQVKKGNTTTLLTPTKENCFIGEWTTNQNGTGTSYEDGQIITVNENIELYAKWYANKVYIFGTEEGYEAISTTWSFRPEGSNGTDIGWSFNDNGATVTKSIDTSINYYNKRGSNKWGALHVVTTDNKIDISKYTKLGISGSLTRDAQGGTNPEVSVRLYNDITNYSNGNDERDGLVNVQINEDFSTYKVIDLPSSSENEVYIGLFFYTGERNQNASIDFTANKIWLEK